MQTLAATLIPNSNRFYPVPFLRKFERISFRVYKLILSPLTSSLVFALETDGEIALQLGIRRWP